MSQSRVRRIVWFLRPTLVVSLCYVVALSFSLRTPDSGTLVLQRKLNEVTSVAGNLSELIKPAPHLSPIEVVRIQTDALRDTRQDRGTLQCALFASPANLRITGPLERFGQMVRGPEFEVLTTSEVVTVGTPVFRGKHARVLVAALDQNRIRPFVWVLARQTDGPYAGCWMTDSVFPLPRDSNASDDGI